MEKLDVLAGQNAAMDINNKKAQNRLINNQAELQSANARKVEAEIDFLTNKTDITDIPARALRNADSVTTYFLQQSKELGKGTQWLFNDFMDRSTSAFRNTMKKLVPSWYNTWKKSPQSQGNN